MQSATFKPCGVLLLVFAVASMAPLSASAGQEEAVPTFSKDIAPIFQAKCEACHRPDSIAPMSLVSYQEARPWARSIKDRVSTRQMPPWHLDRTVGITEFKYDRSLSDDQIDLIARWVDGGAPGGNPADMPPAIEWPDESKWNFAEQFDGPPDLIVESAPYTMPAEANDAWWKPRVETGLTEDRWARAIEMRPGTVAGRKITHHSIARLVQEEKDPALAAANAANASDGQDRSRTAGTFMEWAVGKQGEIMRPGSGKLMLADSQIQWDIHYSAAGEEITDTVQLGVYLYPEDQAPEHRQVLHLMGTGGIDIPPNGVSMTEGFFPLQRGARIESFQPHMHLRGKAMSIEAIMPNGRRRVLSHVGDFNFNWHNTYVYTDEAAPLLPKGTLIKVTAWHDNTAANRSNPDPNVWVGHGDRTVDEMAHAWVNVTYFEDDDYQAEVAKREAADAETQGGGGQ
jgi:hypothetical protein